MNLFTALFASAAVLTVMIIYVVLTLVSNWKVFVKYGEPGWKGLIPFYSIYVECQKVWTTTAGWVIIGVTVLYGILESVLKSSTSTLLSVLSIVAGIAIIVLDIMMNNRKAKAFGKGIGMTIVLVLFPFIGNLVLGLGSAEYLGNPEDNK